MTYSISTTVVEVTKNIHDTVIMASANSLTSFNVKLLWLVYVKTS